MHTSVNLCLQSASVTALSKTVPKPRVRKLGGTLSRQNHIKFGSSLRLSSPCMSDLSSIVNGMNIASAMHNLFSTTNETQSPVSSNRTLTSGLDIELGSRLVNNRQLYWLFLLSLSSLVEQVALNSKRQEDTGVLQDNKELLYHSRLHHVESLRDHDEVSSVFETVSFLENSRNKAACSGNKVFASLNREFSENFVFSRRDRTSATRTRTSSAVEI